MIPISARCGVDELRGDLIPVWYTGIKWMLPSAAQYTRLAVDTAIHDRDSESVGLVQSGDGDLRSGKARRDMFNLGNLRIAKSLINIMLH